MQAIELEAQINELHEIHLKLPDDVNATSAKVIIMYENTPKKIKNVCLDNSEEKLELTILLMMN